MSTAPAAAPRTLRLRGLEAAVEVRFDGVGVPHIRARSLRDLYFAQGFVTASRRLWQLDITRRTARGRLAEVFGPRAVSGDRFQRSLGLVRLAAAKTAALAPDVAGRLRAYADGVNAFIAQGELPEAFHLTGGGAAPRPWTVEDTLCAVELRSIINASWRADLVQLQVLARVGAREAASFFPLARMADGQPVQRSPSPVDTDLYAQLAALLRGAEDALALLGLDDIDTGSNTWAVSGARSETGAPLLANDLHMGYVAPNPNFLVHLTAPGLDVRGVSFPGLPGVTSGHNRRIAWGTTALMADAQDVFLEELDADGLHVRRGRDGWAPLERYRSEIAVRGGEPVAHETLASSHGPIIMRRGRWGLALRTERMGAPAGDPSLFALNTARDWDSFKVAIRDPVLPPTDVSYADVEGNIGAKGCGLIPIRPATDGAMPCIGAVAEHGWDGFLPAEALPEVFNPAEGYLVRANQCHLSEYYPHLLSRRWHPHYRAARARERLLAQAKHSVSSFHDIQRDRTWPHGRVLLARVLPLLEPGAPLRPLLEGWAGELDEDSAAACVMMELSNLLRTRLFEPRLGSALLLDWQRYWPTANVAVELLLESEDPAFLPEGVASYDALLRQALAAAARSVTLWFGTDDMSLWRWGAMCTARFSHTLESLPDQSERYGVRGIPFGSSGECISSSRSISDYISSQQNVALNSARGRQAVFGASARMIWDVADWDRSHLLLNLGQSGDPDSPHYRDQLALWRAGELQRLPFSEARVVEETREMWALHPEAADA